MAYLPFYINPEELAAYQEAQEQEILTGAHLTKWHKYDIDEANRFSSIFHSLVPVTIMSVAFFLFWYNFDQDPAMGFGVMSMLLLGYGVSYLTIGLDYRYDYIFSDKGFVVKKRRNMPTWVNTAVQAVGWIGAIVCVLMVAVAGPMLLVGAGGFILVSFRLLKRQPDEPTEVKVGEREDWLFADYNKKRKVIQFYFKHDICQYQDMEQKKILRIQDRFYCYVFFKTRADLESMVRQLSQVYKLDCTEVADHKKLFEGRPEPRLFDIPVFSREYQTNEVFDLRAAETPLPEREYLYNGQWQTESEIEQAKKEGKAPLGEVT